MFIKPRIGQNGKAAAGREIELADQQSFDGMLKEFPSPLVLRAKQASYPEALKGLLSGGFVFLLFLVVLFIIQFASPNLAGNDGYYHIKLAYLMRTAGLVPNFKWLPLTILNAREFVDHHFLYHILLIPFTFGDLRVGAKAASVLFPALSFTLVWWVLRKEKIPYPALWAAGLLVVSEAFLYRMSMPRVQSLSLAMLVLAFYLLLERKDLWFLPLGFLFVWLYNAFPLLLGMCFLYGIASWLINGKLAWRPFIYAGLGVGAGLVMNPYFPENLFFIWQHISPKLGDPTAIRVGSEWYPYDTTQLMENSGPALLVFLGGVLALGLGKRRMGLGTATSLFLAIFFGLMLFQSRRFVEYFPPFALIFCAFATAPIIKQRLAIAQQSGGSIFDQKPGWSGRIRDLIRKPILISLIFLFVLVSFGWLTLNASTESMLQTKTFKRYAGAAGWLENNSPPGTMVFQTDWDDFPRMFFYNTHNTYTVGLDPTYLQLAGPDLFELWDDISKGREKNPSVAIQASFGGDYVFSDLKHDDFIQEADAIPVSKKFIEMNSA